jgi:phosphate transport system substrate-binding protein
VSGLQGHQEKNSSSPSHKECVILFGSRVQNGFFATRCFFQGVLMKRVLIAASLVSVFSASAFAEVQEIQGSDTLLGALTDAVNQAGLDTQLRYVGGGSGKGAEAIVAGKQGIAPSSRPLKDSEIQAAKAAGIELKGHVFAVDAIGIFVNTQNKGPHVSLDQLRDIYTCKTTNWGDVPGSGLLSTIRAYRRDDASGTTDLFKSALGIKQFGDCVMVSDTAGISSATSKELNAIGYSGLSAGTAKNRAIPVSKANGAAEFLPTIQNVRTNSYPLSRKLYVYESSGTHTPTSSEAALLDKMLDRSFMDPIVQANEFFTID